MYRHKGTKEGEYPHTAREVLHHSLTLLVNEHPSRVVPREKTFGIPAFSWSGAGSEKGGSAEHFWYEKIIFLPERKERVAVVSVGDRTYDFSRMVLLVDEETGDLSEYSPQPEYSVLLSVLVSPSLAETVLDYYRTKVVGVENPGYTFSIALDQILEDGTNHFNSLPLLAVDPKQNYGGGKFLLNRNLFSDGTRSFPEFSPDSWRDSMRRDVQDRVGLSQYIADYAQGRGDDSPLSVRDLLRVREYPYLQRGLGRLSSFCEERLRGTLSR